MLYAETLSVWFPGKSLAGLLSLLRAYTASMIAHCKASTECYIFSFCLFVVVVVVVKVKTLFRFLSISENRY